MVEYKTVKSQDVGFGKNNFIEIARKKAVTPEGETEFISVSRGFVSNSGQRRYKQSVTIPNSKEVVEGIIKAMKELL
ncbi:MAG: hypothetical protein KQA41_01060 [Candidatus Aenigmarchaeota archaeon]|nr:hypothetical protein [Candidatus Aenigmarchaeota archaeon]